MTILIKSEPVPATSARPVLAMVALSLCMLLSSLSTSIANVALPNLAATFEASFQSVQWVVLGYLLGVTTLIVSVGRLGDLVGRRRLLVAGVALFTAASIGCGLSADLGVLIACRVAQGLGAAVMMALTMAFVGEIAPRDRVGRAMGLLGTMSAVGTAMGPTLGGLIIGGFGWRAVFFIPALLGLVAIALTATALPAQAPRLRSARTGFDWTGTAALAAGLTAYALAMTIEKGAAGPLSAGMLAAAAVLGAVFVLVERRAPSPLVRLEMFRDPILAAGLGTSLLVSSVVMSTLVVGPFYLAHALALSPAQVGLAMSAGPVMAAVCGFPAGRAVDRFGARAVAIAGLVAVVIGALALALGAGVLGLPGYVGAVVVMTGGYAMSQTANNTGVMKEVAADRRGVVSGLLSLSRNLGLITGASAMGAVFAVGAGTAAIQAATAEQLAGGLAATFFVAATLAAAALLITLTVRSGAAQLLGDRP